MTTIPRAVTGRAVGELLRGWRDRRRLSQLELAGRAEVSTRHLSYVETGRSRPSRELLLHLADHLDVPHREQNQLLLAAGYAPVFSQLDLDAPAMRPVREVLTMMLDAAAPNPALVMDRHWDLVLANAPAAAWTTLAAPALVAPPANVARLTLHPDGLAPHIVNLDEVAEHVVGRLRRQLASSADQRLRALLDELLEHVPAVGDGGEVADLPPVVPVRIRFDGREREYVSVVSTFGSAVDVTATELLIETFYEV